MPKQSPSARISPFAPPPSPSAGRARPDGAEAAPGPDPVPHHPAPPPGGKSGVGSFVTETVGAARGATEGGEPGGIGGADGSGRATEMGAGFDGSGPAPSIGRADEPGAIVRLAAVLRQAGCVFAEEEAALLLGAARTPAELDAMTRRRAAGTPLEHVIGRADFCGHSFAVDPGVFVPRRRTEFLVRRAARLTPRPAVVVDLCCGSGALGAALAAGLPGTELHSADIDPAAVRCARRNVAAVGGTVHEGDLYAPLPTRLKGAVGVLLANVPYVPTDELPLLPAEARDHEARVALDGGPDGLDVLRRVVAGAAEWLAPGGSLLFETGGHQAARASALVAAGGLVPRIVRSDELDATVVIGRRG
jgi:release factor glutamine methyltransferase